MSSTLTTAMHPWRSSFWRASSGTASNAAMPSRSARAISRSRVRQRGGGSIINVTSQLAEVARPERAAYVASKGGGRSLTHAMALDLAPHGIRANAIAPGPTLTNLTRAGYADPERRRATIAQIPLGRLGDPQDLVGAILFLASDDSVWATGSTVTVDGGYNAM
jgi:NAD(P)-dependent dehydrogenase (short-subunit alcohol dehydrogenase family)